MLRPRRSGLPLLLALAACSSEVDVRPDAGTPSIDAFDVWREMQGTLRQSPDHLPGRAQALVAARDPEVLTRFVRDALALVPPSPDGFFGAATEVRHGPRATLRGGVGTPRERAELLADLLREAGFEATVVVGRFDPPVDVSALLARGPTRNARYDADAATIARWQGVLGARVEPSGGAVTKLDPTGAERRALLAAVQPLVVVPEPRAAPDTTAAELPFVRVMIDGVARYAHPNVPDAPIGDARTRDEPVEAPPPTGERTLSVTLRAARSDRPNEPFVLLERTYAASEVAGRMLTFAFTTPDPYADARRKKVDDADVFIPFVTVRGDGLDARASQALSAIGAAVTRDGERLEITPAGRVELDGAPIARGPTPRAVLDRVRALEVTARAEAFGSIELRVAARDVSRRLVPGLAADALVVEEDGRPVAARVRATEARPPRVLLLFDRSASIPPAYLERSASVGRAIAAEIFAAFPAAEVRVAGLSSVTPEFAGPFVGAIADVEAQLAALGGLGSELWGNLAAVAADRETTAIVLVSDVQAEDRPSPELLGAIWSGPPLLVAGVGEVATSTATQLAALTDGVVFTDFTPETLGARVRRFLSERGDHAYRLTYAAPASGARRREVSVRVSGTSTITGRTTYDVPERPLTPTQLSALYLTVATNGRELTRTLAGSARGSVADRAATRDALFGRFTLGVEAGAPALSVLLDEHIGERLQYEARYDALVARAAAPSSAADDAARRLARAMPSRAPVELRFAAAPLRGDPAAEELTQADGLSLALHTRVPVFGRGVLEKLDLLPLVPRATLRRAGGDGFTRTLEKTAELAVYEAARYTTSAVMLLRGERLGRFDPLTIDAELGPAWAAPVRSAFLDHQIIAPVDGSPVAFFAVHEETGELIGGLADGSGGGVGHAQRPLAEGESTEALVDRLLTILDVAKRAGEAFGYEGVAAWADLESTKVTLLGDVIMLFEGGESTDPIGDLLGDLCSAGLDELGGPIPGFDLASMPFDDLDSVYRATRVMTGAETPEDIPGLGGPSDTACAAILAP